VTSQKRPGWLLAVLLPGPRRGKADPSPGAPMAYGACSVYVLTLPPVGDAEARVKAVVATHAAPEQGGRYPKVQILSARAAKAEFCPGAVPEDRWRPPGGSGCRLEPVERPEIRFRAMGTSVHILLNGDAGLLAQARQRVEELDARWSRFRPDSELTRLNQAGGGWVTVSPDTLSLVRRALQGWHQTSGAFDPTLLGAVVRAGYDRDFDLLAAGRAEPDQVSGPQAHFRPGCAGIRVRGSQVLLPAGVGLDSGGLGKGLAADLVAMELVRAGARGACVNLGGDLRVVGDSGQDGWTLGIDYPGLSTPLCRVGLAGGGLATSTTLLRRWEKDGTIHHHLIDPGTESPADGPILLAAVVSREAWLSEVLAKAVILSAPGAPFAGLAGTGAEGLAVDRDGRIWTSPAWSSYVGDQVVPEDLSAWAPPTGPVAADEAGPGSQR
jgi:thiamine biosynthesis lipoprotein